MISTTLIPTPEGWTTLEDIAPGKQVFDHAGRVCRVTNVHSEEVVPAYRVTFDDGTTMVAGRRHQWITTPDQYRERIREGTAHLALWATPAMFGITTLDIRKTLTRDVGGTIKTNHSVPLARGMELPHKELPVSPRLLGLWLGDGSSDASVIHCHWMDEPHLRRSAEKAGEPWRRLREKGSVLTCSLARGEGVPFVTRLRELGVLRNKHVPDAYLRSDFDQRLELLRGLMDSDGHVDDRGCAEFTSKSAHLAAGVLELALSLGQKATPHVGRATLNGRFISDKHRVRFSPTLNVFALPRKAEILERWLRYRETVPFPRVSQRYIRDVEFVGWRKTTCIAVDSSSRLVLAGRAMIPTLSCAPVC